MIIYITFVRPFDTSFSNNIEVFNEICILLGNYPLFLFTEFLDTESYANNANYIGYVLIGLGMVNILVNMIIIFKKSFRDIKEGCKRLKERY